jgi:hypothetical protein
MKKFRFFALSVVLALFIGQISAQVQHQEKKLRSEIKTERKDIRKQKKDLHKLEGKVVSDLSKSNFYADFGSVPNVKWTRDDYFDIAEFNLKGLPTKAFYDYNSKLVGTSSIKTFAGLPQNAQKQIKKEYPDYTPGQVIFFKDNEKNDTDMILYDTQFEDSDNYFVELSKANKNIVVQVNPEGEVFFFKDLNP